MPALCYIPLGFLCGSVLFSYHFPLWLKHINIVALSGDHNPGTANAFRFAGVPVGILCLLFDIGKGAAPVWLYLQHFELDSAALPLVMLSPLAGHAFSPWYGFHGGKAIATAFGVLIGLFPHGGALTVLVFWYLFYSLVVVIHPNERRTVYTFICYAACCIVGAVYTRLLWLGLGCVLVAVLPIYKNSADIRRAESEMKRVPVVPGESEEDGAEGTASPISKG